MTVAHHLEVGEWGEKTAESFLIRKGYRVLGRRVRVGRREEVDLVVLDGHTVVFVEIKTRAGEAFGRPVAAVDRAKRRTLSRAAIRFLKRLRNPPVYFRFDVVEVIGTPEIARPVIRHIENAFPLDHAYTLPV
ncbi:MAG: YraN family protein [Kiritimatiellae bacterium]|nr:YraN family protein [Kiritimatiellia bacterium]